MRGQMSYQESLNKKIAEFQAKCAGRMAELQSQRIPLDVPEQEAVHPRIECEMCGDIGYVHVNVPPGHELFGKDVPCPRHCKAGRAYESKLAKRLISGSALPPRYQKFTFVSWAELPEDEKREKYLARAACELFHARDNHYSTVNDIRELIDMEPAPDGDNPKNSLMLFGDVGMGKTGLMAALMRELLAQGERVLYIRANDLIKQIQDTYNPDSLLSTQEVVRGFVEYPILFIDEFNIVNLKPDRLEHIESVMRGRYGNMKPTLMTANVNQDGFEAQWGLRTKDVVCAMAHWILVGGLKLRLTEPEIQGA